MIEINRNPSQRDLRVFALGLAVLASLGGWWLRRRWGLEWGAPLGLIVGAAVAACGIGRPSALRLVYVGWMTACWPIGWLVSHVLLGIVYYLIVTPLAVALRMAGRDPLERHLDREATTYWKPRTKKREPSSYFKTF